MLFIDNEQIVTKYQSMTVSSSRPDAFSPGGTWAAVVYDLMLGNPLPLRVEWMKGHASFLGNKIAGPISRSAAACLVFNLSLLQHSHSNIPVKPSFDFYNSSWCFVGVAFKFASGGYNMPGYQWGSNLHNFRFFWCSVAHPLAPVFCIAFSPQLDDHRQALTPCGLPRFLLSSNTGGPHALSNQINKILRARLCPHLSGPSVSAANPHLLRF